MACPWASLGGCSVGVTASSGLSASEGTGVGDLEAPNKVAALVPGDLPPMEAGPPKTGALPKAELVLWVPPNNAENIDIENTNA